MNTSGLKTMVEIQNEKDAEKRQVAEDAAAFFGTSAEKFICDADLRGRCARDLVAGGVFEDGDEASAFCDRMKDVMRTGHISASIRQWLDDTRAVAAKITDLRAHRSRVRTWNIQKERLELELARAEKKLNYELGRPALADTEPKLRDQLLEDYLVHVAGNEHQPDNIGRHFCRVFVETAEYAKLMARVIPELRRRVDVCKKNLEDFTKTWPV